MTASEQKAAAGDPPVVFFVDGVATTPLEYLSAAASRKDSDAIIGCLRDLAKPIDEFTRRNAAKNDAGFLAADIVQSHALSGQVLDVNVARMAEAGCFEPWPIDQPPRYNGSGTPCDMWTGPCCCGATHKDGV